MNADLAEWIALVSALGMLLWRADSMARQVTECIRLALHSGPITIRVEHVHIDDTSPKPDRVTTNS